MPPPTWTKGGTETEKSGEGRGGRECQRGQEAWGGGGERGVGTSVGGGEGIVASRRGKKRDGSSAVAARRYSRHSIWYFSLCIADSSNCSASRALIYRPAGPLSRPSGSELSFAYSHGTYSSTSSSPPPPPPSCCPLSPNALHHSSLPPSFKPPHHPVLSSLYTELSPRRGELDRPVARLF